MLLCDLVKKLDSTFKKNLAFGWDRAGLQIGDMTREIKSILTTVDVNDDVINEAIKKNAELIFSHHPLIFNPLKTLISSEYSEKKLLRIIENKIAVYTAHTNYDIMPDGLNDYLLEKLDLKKTGYLEASSAQWYKFVIFVPFEAEEKVREAICRHGGGNWGDYSCCTFNIGGKGTFKPLTGSNPYTGEKGKLNFVDEVRIECIVDEDNLDGMVKAAIKAHPYEEAAYDIYRIENRFENFGIGAVGKPEKEINAETLLKLIKEKLDLEGVNWMTQTIGEIEASGSSPAAAVSETEAENELSTIKIRKIALCSGSSNSLAEKIKDSDCDAVITGEMDYHNCLKIIESGKLLILTGHGSSEKIAVEHFSKFLDELIKKEDLNINIFKSKQGYKSWRYYIG